MEDLLNILREPLPPRRRKPVLPVNRPAPLQVMVPNLVTLPLPAALRDEICVPASINGRDLSTGRP